MDPLTILAGLKTGLAAGKTVASLSKEISNFFDATDAAKKKKRKIFIPKKFVLSCIRCKILKHRLTRRHFSFFKNKLCQ